MLIREYNVNDGAETFELFYNTVNSINSKNYNREQLGVWADKNDKKSWCEKFNSGYTYVAIIDNVIVGIGEIDKKVQISRLYVHKDFQRQGIASKILDKLEACQFEIGIDKISTSTAIDGKEFYENKGFKIVWNDNKFIKGVNLPSYKMEKEIIN